MIVHQDHRGGGKLERSLDHLARIDRCVIDGAGLLLLVGDEVKAGDYQLVFRIKDYFAARGADTVFFAQAAVFFHIHDPGASYHVPLLVTPWAYSTYRGS